MMDKIERVQTEYIDLLDEVIAEGDIILVKDHHEYETSAFVVFMHKYEWVVQPLFDVHIRSYEDLNGIEFSAGETGFGTLSHIVSEYDVKIFGNIYSVSEFVNWYEEGMWQ